jgi:hypothetical protein
MFARRLVASSACALITAPFLLRTCHAHEPASSTLEPSTGISFPLKTRVFGSTGMHTCLGIGVRQITLFRFNTYALGIYLNSHDISRAKNVESGKGLFASLEWSLHLGEFDFVQGNV